MRLKQRQTLAVVEFAVKIDGLDVEVKAVKETTKTRRGTLLAVSPSVRRRTASV